MPITEQRIVDIPLEPMAEVISTKNTIVKVNSVALHIPIEEVVLSRNKQGFTDVIGYGADGKSVFRICVFATSIIGLLREHFYDRRERITLVL